MGGYLDRVLLAVADADPTATDYDLPEDIEDQPDWDEADADDVGSYLTSQSPWYGRVLAGESPGEPYDTDNPVSATARTAEASTVPEPTGKPGGPGLFRIKGRELPPYVQHLYKHLVGKYGKHRAYGVAIGVVKKWAAGINPGGKGKGHKVHADVQAAAAKNVANWEESKAMAHRREHAKATVPRAREDVMLSGPKVTLAAVKGYEAERFGRIVHVSNYMRRGDKEPFNGTLIGKDADEAIKRGEAIGEFGEPTGYFQTSDGKRMWGWYGAAGLLARHKGSDGKTRYLLQKRAPWVDEGNTYSVPGGALDHDHGVPETPLAGALREGREEGMVLPESARPAEVKTKTFGEGDGAWSYHTVVVDTPHFDPGAEGSTGESRGYIWATPEEMADLPLHRNFRATAEELGMPKGGGTRPPERGGFDAGKMNLGLARPYEREEHGKLEHVSGYIDLYHHTTPENAKAILASKHFESLDADYPGAVHFANRPNNAGRKEYGQAIVHIRVPRSIVHNSWEHRAPGGLMWHWVDQDDIRPEHFVKPYWDPGVKATGSVPASSALALARPYEREEHGKLEHVSGYARRLLAQTHDGFRVYSRPDGNVDIHWYPQGSEMATYTSTTARNNRAVNDEIHRMRGELARERGDVEHLADLEGREPGAATAPLYDIGLAAPAGRPSGRPYAQSMLPKPASQGTAPGARGLGPIAPGKLVHAPSQTVAAGPPLPPGATLPSAKEADDAAALIAKLDDSPTIKGAAKHLESAATKLSNGEYLEALHNFRSAQAGVRAAHRDRLLKTGLPVANVFSTSLDPDEHRQAQQQMDQQRQETASYKEAATTIAQMIDRIRRWHFHGQLGSWSLGRFTADVDDPVALVFGFHRKALSEAEKTRQFDYSPESGTEADRARMMEANRAMAYQRLNPGGRHLEAGVVRNPPSYMERVRAHTRRGPHGIEQVGESFRHYDPARVAQLEREAHIGENADFEHRLGSALRAKADADAKAMSDDQLRDALAGRHSDVFNMRLRNPEDVAPQPEVAALVAEFGRRADHEEHHPRMAAFRHEEPGLWRDAYGAAFPDWDAEFSNNHTAIELASGSAYLELFG